MKTKLSFLIFFFPFLLLAQETPKEKLDRLTNEIKVLVKQEKENLKVELENVDKQLENNEIDKIKAAELKKSLSVTSAEKIAAIVTERSNEITELTQEIVKEALETETETEIDTTVQNKKHEIAIDIKKNFEKEKEWKRTASDHMLGFGFNNVLLDGSLASLDDSPYPIWNSNYFEMGHHFKTALNKESSLVNFTYGYVLQWRELKLFDNQYHVDNGDYTVIAINTENDLKKSKLRNTSIVIPIGFEFDFSGKKEVDGKIIPLRNEGFKFGMEAFGGFRINSKQIIKYDQPRDQKKEKINGDYNMNNLIYGLQGYVGYKDYALILKYDINPLFKNTDTQNVALGLRFEF